MSVREYLISYAWHSSRIENLQILVDFLMFKQFLYLSFFLQILKKGLHNILTMCKNSKTTCQPIDQMSATVVLALVENRKNPGLLPHLRRIVLDESLPLDVRAKAVLAVRPLSKVVPSKVCFLCKN